MPIASDFSIDYVNKRIYHSANTNLYTVNELYSWLMSTFDDLTQMDDTVPITAQTPTEYTLTNGWFMDDDSIKYLYGGAIQTSGWGSGAIRHLHVSATGYTSPIPSDIGKTVVGGTTGDTGTLLSYSTNESGNYEWYVRPDVPGTDLFDDPAEAYTITTGTGAGDAYKAAPTGETLWANIYTLGTIASDPYALMYVKRGSNEVVDGYVFDNTRADSANWWNVGHIDVLLKVKDADVLKNDAEVTVYGRQYGDLYDQFTINLTAGGRNAVPLATSTDLDNSTGSHYLLVDAVATIPVVGELIDNGGTFRAEVVGVTDWTGTALLELGNVIVGDLADNDTLAGTVGGAGLATVNGTLGDTYFEYAAEAVALTTGLVITGGTTGATRLVTGIQDDGTTGKVISRVQDTPATTDYAVFALGDVAETITDSGTGSVTSAAAASTTIVSGFSDVQVWFANQQLSYDAGTVDFAIGEIVTGGTSGATGVVMQISGTTATGVLVLGNRSSTFFQDNEAITGDIAGAAVANGTGYTSSSINQAFTQQAAASYKVVIDCAGRPLSEMYAYLKFVTGEGSTYGLYRTTDDALTTYKLFDAVGATYTDDLTAANNLVSTGDVDVFDAVDGAEVGDIVYISGVDPFTKVKIQQRTQGVGVWTHTWEYWSGATWTALPGIGVDGVAGDAEALHFRGITGKHYITYNMPTDWATTTVDGVLGYFVRARISAYTSTTTAPTLDYLQLYGPQDTVEGRVYSEAHFGYVPVKQAPFGTFAGGTFFGARGIWVQNMDSNDIQNYQLKDANNVGQTPPNFQNLTVSNLVSGDTVAIFRTSGGVIDKAVFTSTAGNTSGNGTFVINEAIPSDTPTTGFLRIVESTTGAEERAAYTSWTGSTFTLTGTLAASYGVGDTAYVPYIDVTATGITETVTVIYSASRPILTRVRRYNGAGDSILPFEAPGTFGSSGYSIATIRTEDAIVN